MSMFRCLSLACLALALAGCQGNPVRDSQSQLFQRHLAQGQLAQADQLLADAETRGVDAEQLAPFQRQLADAYLQQGQRALQQGDLDTATTALSRARSLLPAAPALTAGLGDPHDPRVRSIMLPLLDKGDYTALAEQFDQLTAELLACDCRIVLETRGNWQSKRAAELLRIRLATGGNAPEVEISHVASRVPRLLLVERDAVR